VPDDAPRRRPRRAVGPAGAAVGDEPDLGLRPAPPPTECPAEDADGERYRRERPPHHDRGV
jgi:hypothetical protein